MMWLYLAEEKNCKCLGHFLGIHGDCSTSVREEFHPNPLQIQIQIYNTAIFNHRSLFRYANSSTLHSYGHGCLWVSEWAEFHTSVAWSLFLYWKCVFPFDQGPCFWSELDRTASNFRGLFGPFLIVKKASEMCPEFTGSFWRLQKWCEKVKLD